MALDMLPQLPEMSTVASRGLNWKKL